MNADTTRATLSVDITIDTELLNADYPETEGRETQALANLVALLIGDNLRTTDENYGLSVEPFDATPCACHYTAPHAEVSAAFHHYAKVIVDWDTAAFHGNPAAKADAADGMALILQNLPNFDRPAAIGLAEALLRYVAGSTGLVDYAGLTTAEIATLRD